MIDPVLWIDHYFCQLDEGTLGMPGREYLLKGLEDKDVQAYLNYQIS